MGREVLRIPAPPDRVILRSASRSHEDPDHRFDLGRPESVGRVIRKNQPAHVLLVAAATNVAWCEEHPDESWAINARGPRATAEAARDVGATLTFISTDYVFNGDSGPYAEGDPTDPINVYGSHKLEAEKAVLEANAGNLVIRTCQVFGEDSRRANFVLRLVDRLRTGEEVETATDLYGTPTFAPDLAKAVVDLTLNRASGLWHVAGDTFLSRYELASRVVALFGCASGVVLKVRVDEMGDVVNRPRRAGLTSGRLTSAGLDLITPLDTALAALAAREPTR